MRAATLGTATFQQHVRSERPPRNAFARREKQSPATCDGTVASSPPEGPAARPLHSQRKAGPALRVRPSCMPPAAPAACPRPLLWARGSASRKAPKHRVTGPRRARLELPEQGPLGRAAPPTGTWGRLLRKRRVTERRWAGARSSGERKPGPSCSRLAGRSTA